MQKKIYKITSIKGFRDREIEDSMTIRGWKRAHGGMSGRCVCCDAPIFVGEPYFQLMADGIGSVCLGCCEFENTGKFRDGTYILTIRKI